MWKGHMRVIFHESFFMFKIELEKARLRQNSKHDLDTKSNFLFLYCSFFITMKPSIITRKNGGSVFSRRKKTCLSMAVLLSFSIKWLFTNCFGQPSPVNTSLVRNWAKFNGKMLQQNAWLRIITLLYPNFSLSKWN